MLKYPGQWVKTQDVTKLPKAGMSFQITHEKIFMYLSSTIYYINHRTYHTVLTNYYFSRKHKISTYRFSLREVFTKNKIILGFSQCFPVYYTFFKE
jgi:hypothetical protein